MDPGLTEIYEHPYIDKTAYHPEQAHWTIENLPTVLYVLRPGTQYSKSRARIRQTSKEIFGRHIREFLVLPVQISTHVEGWRLEAWWRLDRRIEAQDILDRMDPRARAHNGVEETELEMRREQFRRDFYVADWRSQVSINDLARTIKSKGLDPVATNSTRGITPGLIDPEKCESAGRIPIPSHGGAQTGPQSLSFVLRGMEKPVSNTRTVSSDGIVFDIPSPRGEPRSAMNLCQSPGHKLLSSCTPHLPTIKRPQSLKRMAPESAMPVTPSPQKRMPTIDENIPVVHGHEISVEMQKKPTYPDAHCELATHQNTPRFLEQSMTSEDTIMTLEEYLDCNQMTFDEYLCREENQKDQEKKQKTGKNKANHEKMLVTTPGKGNVVDPWLTVL